MEQWRSVIGFEGKYEVSDLGNVRSLDRIIVHKQTERYSRKVTMVEHPAKGRVLRPGRQKSGHVTVALGRKNSRLVHVLVLTAFVGPCPEGEESLHKNGRPDDNRLENLHWGTRSQNLLDAVEHGQKPVGEAHSKAKLKNADIPIIRSLFTVVPYTEIAKRYGVAESTIRQIANGKCWKHIKEAA